MMSSLVIVSFIVLTVVMVVVSSCSFITKNYGIIVWNISSGSHAYAIIYLIYIKRLGFCSFYMRLTCPASCMFQIHSIDSLLIFKIVIACFFFFSLSDVLSQ